jgi:hypothetical protein
MILAGVDPGVSGGIAAIDDVTLRVLATADLPIVRSASLAWLDGGLFRDWLEQWRPEIVVLEQVAWRRGDETKANIAALIRIAGGIEAVVSLCGLPLVHVMPGEWKRRAGLAGRDKPASIALARSRLAWPEGALALKKNHNVAEAGLIALFGRKPAAPPKLLKRAKETSRPKSRGLPLFDEPAPPSPATPRQTEP